MNSSLRIGLWPRSAPPAVASRGFAAGSSRCRARFRRGGQDGQGGLGIVHRRVRLTPVEAIRRHRLRQKRRALRAGGRSSAGLNSVRFASLRGTGPPHMAVRARSRRSAGSPGRHPAFSECPQEPPALEMPAPSAHSRPSRGPPKERRCPMRHIEGLDHLVLPATPGRS